MKQLILDLLLFGAIGALWPESKAATAGYDPSGLPYTPGTSTRGGVGGYLAGPQASRGPSLPGPSGPPVVSQGAFSGSPLSPFKAALTSSMSPISDNPWQSAARAPRNRPRSQPGFRAGITLGGF